MWKYISIKSYKILNLNEQLYEVSDKIKWTMFQRDGFLFSLTQTPYFSCVFSPRWKTLLIGEPSDSVRWDDLLNYLALCIFSAWSLWHRYLCHCHRNWGCHFCEVTSIQRDPSTEVSLKYRLCIKHAVAMQIYEKEYKKMPNRYLWVHWENWL